VRDILQARSSDGSSAEIEARTVYCKETPLTFAAYSGSWAVVQLLLQAGANPNLPRLVDAVRPLDLAVALKHARLACLLLDRGAEVGLCGWQSQACSSRSCSSRTAQDPA
jgi:ankyrin repeat protein